MPYDFNQMGTPVPGTTAGNAQDPVYQQNLSNLVASGARPDLASKATVPPQVPGAPGSPTGAPTAPLVPTTPVTANLPLNIPSTALTQNVTFQDIQKLMNENSKLQQQYLQSLAPTAAETTAQNELMAINQAERQQLFQQESRFAPDFAVQGTQRRISQQAALSRLAKSEELAALTGQRQSKLEGIKAALGFGSQNLESLLGIDKYFRDIAKDEKQEARDTLAFILESSSGFTLDSLSKEDQKQIQQLAKQAGLPIQAVQKALQANQVAQQEEVLKFALETGITSRFINLSGTVWDMYERRPLNLEQFQQLTGQQVGLPPEQTNFSMVAELPTATQPTRASAGEGGGGGDTIETSPGKPQFTNSQLNKGAVNAGLPFEEFQGLHSDIQNYYINAGASKLQEINDTMADVANGVLSPEDVKAGIDASAVSPAVKEYFKSLVDKNTPAQKDKEGGFWSNLFEDMSNFLYRR